MTAKTGKNTRIGVVLMNGQEHHIEQPESISREGDTLTVVEKTRTWMISLVCNPIVVYDRDTAAWARESMEKEADAEVKDAWRRFTSKPSDDDKPN